MKKLISALWLVSTLATSAAWAQPYAPNDAGVTNGHWHLNSRDVAANKHILLSMGGVAIGPGERVQFPGVLARPYQGSVHKTSPVYAPGARLSSRPTASAAWTGLISIGKYQQWQGFDGPDSAPKDTKPKGFPT